MCIQKPFFGRVADLRTIVLLPYFEAKVPAGSGFPSPALDYRQKQIDLNELLIKDPEATFLVGVEGDSMDKALINSHSILIVDRSDIPESGDIIIAIVDDEWTAKYYVVKDKNVWLVPHSTNPKHQPRLINEYQGLRVWGVVRKIINEPPHPFH